jgi:hypothetical protein
MARPSFARTRPGVALRAQAVHAARRPAPASELRNPDFRISNMRPHHPERAGRTVDASAAQSFSAATNSCAQWIGSRRPSVARPSTRCAAKIASIVARPPPWLGVNEPPPRRTLRSSQRLAILKFVDWVIHSGGTLASRTRLLSWSAKSGPVRSYLFSSGGDPSAGCGGQPFVSRLSVRMPGTSGQASCESGTSSPSVSGGQPLKRGIVDGSPADDGQASTGSGMPS